MNEDNEINNNNVIYNYEPEKEYINNSLSDLPEGIEIFVITMTLAINRIFFII